MMDRLQSLDFQPYLDQTFRVRLEGSEPIDLELVSVTEIGQSSRPAARRPVSLIFRGPVSQLYLRQHIYRLEHDQTGQLDLFIVPIGPEAGRMRYEAILA
jgi:hypothetical protein